jgi:hypothetical protein
MTYFLFFWNQPNFWVCVAHTGHDQVFRGDTRLHFDASLQAWDSADNQGDGAGSHQGAPTGLAAVTVYLSTFWA